MGGQGVPSSENTRFYILCFYLVVVSVLGGSAKINRIFYGLGGELAQQSPARPSDTRSFGGVQFRIICP